MNGQILAESQNAHLKESSYEGTYSLFTSIASSSTESILDSFLKVKPKYLESYEDAFKRRIKRKNQIFDCMQYKGYKKILMLEDYTDKIIPIKLYCNNKMCRACQKRRAIRLRFEIMEIIKGYKNPVLVTYSGRNKEELTRKIIQDEKKIFMRTREYIKRGNNIKTGKKFRFDDYVAVMEIKLNMPNDIKYRIYRKSGRWKRKNVGKYDKKEWNIHFHMIYDGDYIPIKWAKSCFKKASKGESHHVCFNYIRDVENISAYISNYVTKMCFREDFVEEAKTYYKETKGLKFITVEGKRPEKIYRTFNCKNLYEQIKKYFRGYENVDIMLVIQEIRWTIDYYNLSAYEIKKSIEENVLLYADEETKLKACGV